MKGPGRKNQKKTFFLNVFSGFFSPALSLQKREKTEKNQKKTEKTRIRKNPQTDPLDRKNRKKTRKNIFSNRKSVFCYTGVDQILTKYAGDSTQHQSTMLPRRRCFLRSKLSLPCYPFLQDEGSPARGEFVSLSPCSRGKRCYVPCKVLAIAHATMTLLLVAPLRLSLKDKRKETHASSRIHI